MVIDHEAGAIPLFDVFAHASARHGFSPCLSNTGAASIRPSDGSRAPACLAGTLAVACRAAAHPTPLIDFLRDRRVQAG
jgi:hypothetical protein